MRRSDAVNKYGALIYLLKVYVRVWRNWYPRALAQAPWDIFEGLTRVRGATRESSSLSTRTKPRPAKLGV